jgi:hypothetical protein
MIWAWSALLSGWHETALKSKQFNSWLIIRQIGLTLFTIVSILVFYNQFMQMILILSFGKLIFVLSESYFVFDKRIKVFYIELICSLITITPILLLG